MIKNNLFKYLFIPLWFGILILPFMGIKGAVFTAIAIGAGWGVFFFLARLNILRLIKFELPFRKVHVTKRNAWFANAALLFISLILPNFLNNYYIDVLTIAGMYAVLALGLNIVIGLAGLLDLGYISFYAVGAYTYALLSTKLSISFWMAIPIGGLLAALFGFILGVVTLRLRGDYLAIVTLGFIQIVHIILKNWDSLTGGPNGILGIARPRIGSFIFSQPIHFYYLILIILVITIAVVNRLNNSRTGRAWIAIREDEIAAEAMGVDTTRMKCLAFSLGAFWAGITGVFFAGKFAFVSPESFTFMESILILSIVVLGGMGSIPGVIIGALTIIILPEVLRGFANYRMLIFGALLIIMMVVRPQGLIGSQKRKVELHPHDEKIYLQEMESLYDVEKG
ncbi:MAG: hypothetical protein A2073_04715 [Deltaproteobacteria bacterium GWC2_42_11]|nr:MAG: hypothetical protein A2073_04715 [Deltaproteobacteria bacterium GWC2_42_11]HBO85275.1 branched-chain amino acid ABC transporter permease [Deltaproteobacteria bacterium]